MRSELGLPAQKALLICDAFKAQSIETVKPRMSTIEVESAKKSNTSIAATRPRHNWIGEEDGKSLSVGITLHAFQKL